MIVEKIHIKEIIGGRYDNSFVLYHHRLANFKYPSYPLSRFLTGKPQYGAGEAGIPRENNESPRYIRITDIDVNGSLDNNIGVTAKKVENKYILNNNDILIARSGNTVGKSYIHKTDRVKEPCFYAGYLIRFVVDASQISPDYVFIFTKLSLFSDWVKVTQRITGQPNINAEEYSNLPIPVPPVEVQQEIVDIYLKAQHARSNKIQEAKQLLDGIDDFLLETLQIEQNQGHVKSNKSIIRNASSLIGNRLDVSYYSDRFEMISSKYKNVRLSSIVDVDPTISFKQYTPDTPISFIPMESIDEQYGEITELKETTISKTKGYTKFEENDLLWAKITPCMQNGKSAIAKNLKNGIGCGSTEYFVMRPKNKHVLIDYIYLILRHHEVLKAAQSSFGGSAGQQRVSSQYLKSIMIPHPDLLTQIKIVTTIYKMKNKAKQLQQEGDALLEEAKKRIEKMIIG
ncbi:restriction endonuclease subunit S [bacterium]|nr:restriction endonuclease subunit S [bacterium]